MPDLDNAQTSHDGPDEREPSVTTLDAAAEAAYILEAVRR